MVSHHGYWFKALPGICKRQSRAHAQLMLACDGVSKDRPTMPYSTPPGQEDLEYVSEELPDPKSLQLQRSLRPVKPQCMTWFDQ